MDNQTVQRTLSQLSEAALHRGVDPAAVEQALASETPQDAMIGLLLRCPTGNAADTSKPAASSLGKIVVVAGPPASGKGTQCKMLQKELGHVHISTGDIFREAVAKQTPFGLEVQAYMDRDQFVPDEVTMAMIREKLEEPEVQERGALIDGFPRTPEQARALTEYINIDRYILLNAPEKVCVERAIERLMDPVTGEIYNTKTVPPPADIAGRLQKRSNDCDRPTVKNRVQTYKSLLDGILLHFAGKTQRVDGTKSIDEVHKAILDGVDDPTSFDIPVEESEEEWGDEEEVAVDAVALGVYVTPTFDITPGHQSTTVVVSVKVPDIEKRAPADVCCVVDISGSMSTRATYEDESGQTKDADGLTILDIVKHSVRTVVHMLKDEDRLSLVAFDHEAELVFPLKEMTEVGRRQAESALDALRPRGRTNIWGGIHAGMESIKTPGEGGDRTKAILLLTDGMPNVEPNRGHIPVFKDYKEANAGFGFQLNTFGFGNSLDSKLLVDLAVEGGGTYAFIPDAAIVGTCFVNSTANILTTLTQSATVHLKPQGGATFDGNVYGGLESTTADWGTVVSLGSLQLGSSREVVVPMIVPPTAATYLDVVVTYPDANGREIRTTALGTERTASELGLASWARVDSVDTTNEAMSLAVNRKGDDARVHIERLVKRIQDLCMLPLGEKNEQLKALEEDVAGRLQKGLSTDERIDRWGKHYIRALTRAHQLQLCTNFMDPGLQVYGGTLFKSVKEEGGELFKSLPPPKPTGGTRTTYTASTTTTTTQAPNMQAYYAGAGGGCFGALSRIVTVTSTGVEVTKCVKDVQAGQSVRVGDGGVARVLCCVKVARPVEKLLVNIGDLQITPKHPVRLNGSWQLPESTTQARAAGGRICAHEGYVYNLVLDRCHVLLVNGIECVTWGHGFGGAVLEHAYFGTSRIIDDLKSLAGWQRGHVTMEFTRDARTWEVNGLREVTETNITPEEQAAFHTADRQFQWSSSPAIFAI